MRHLILPCIMLLAPLLASSQTSFEGLIRYKAKPAEEVVQSSDASGTDSIMAYFGPDRIRTEAYVKGKLIQTTLVALDQGKIFELDPAKKTFTSRSLAISDATPLGAIENIAGYTVRPLTGKLYKAMASGMSYSAWVSDSLLFPISEKYDDQMELIFVQQGHIALKLLIVFQMQATSFGSEGPSVKNLVNAWSITAMEVLPGKVAKELLSVPADYTLMNENGPVRKFKLDEVKLQEPVQELPPPPPAPPAPPAKRKGG